MDFEDELPENRRRRRKGHPALPEGHGYDLVPSGQEGPDADPHAQVIPYDEPTELLDHRKVQAATHIQRPVDIYPHWDEILKKVMDEFVEKNTTSSAGTSGQSDTEYSSMINQLVLDHPQWGVNNFDIPKLIELLRIYQFGYGPLQNYLDLSGLEEIYFNRYDSGFYLRNGTKKRIDQEVFKNEAELRNFLSRVCSENEISLNREKPNIDAQLKDGSRLNATIEPLVDDGPTFNIRKHPEMHLTIEDYISGGTLTPELVVDIQRYVTNRLTIIVAGGTRSGKTTFLNTICNAYLPSDTRLLILESIMKEMKIETEDIKYFQTKEDSTRSGNPDDITMRDLIKQTLRKAPDRVFVGEIRGPEAYPALRAWNSGHPGSMCTVHSDDALEAISTMEMLALQAGEMSETGIRRTIASAVDIVIHIENVEGQSARQITEILQVLHPRKIDRRHRPTVERFKQMMENGDIEEVNIGDPSMLYLKLYEEDLDGNIVKVHEPLRLRKAPGL